MIGSKSLKKKANSKRFIEFICQMKTIERENNKKCMKKKRAIRLFILLCSRNTHFSLYIVFTIFFVCFTLCIFRIGTTTTAIFVACARNNYCLENIQANQFREEIRFSLTLSLFFKRAHSTEFIRRKFYT